MTTANKNVMPSIAAQNTQDSFQRTHPILPLDCFGNGTQTEAGRNMQGECVHVKLCVYMGVCVCGWGAECGSRENEEADSAPFISYDYLKLCGAKAEQ